MPDVSDLDALLAHPEIERIAARLRARPGTVVDEPDERYRRAAVAVVVRVGAEDTLELLMIKRAEHDRDPWSGHVALPGGRWEMQDADLEATAVRETLEETGIDIAREGRILGALDELHPRTPTLPPIIVRPYVAVVRPDVSIVYSPEVADAFWVRLGDLREHARWIQTSVIVRDGELRGVTAFQHGQYIIWGMTERMLRRFTSLLED